MEVAITGAVVELIGDTAADTDVPMDARQADQHHDAAPTWVLHFDGACRRRSTVTDAASGAGAALCTGTTVTWNIARYLVTRRTRTIRAMYTAEYIALIEGLRGALHHGVRCLLVKGDSTLILEQIQSRYVCNNPRLRKLRNQARRLLQRLDNYVLMHVDRLRNKDADALANKALDSRRTRTECATHGTNGPDCSRHPTQDQPAAAAPPARLAREMDDPDDTEATETDADVARRDRGRTFPVLPVTADSVPARQPRLKLRSNLKKKEMDAARDAVHRIGHDFDDMLRDVDDWDT